LACSAAHPSHEGPRSQGVVDLDEPFYLARHHAQTQSDLEIFIKLAQALGDPYLLSPSWHNLGLRHRVITPLRKGKELLWNIPSLPQAVFTKDSTKKPMELLVHPANALARNIKHRPFTSPCLNLSTAVHQASRQSSAGNSDPNSLPSNVVGGESQSRCKRPKQQKTYCDSRSRRYLTAKGTDRLRNFLT